MSYGEDEGAGIDYQIMRGRDYPSIRQFTIFLENRVGQLLNLVRRFQGSDVRIVALNIHDSTECSIVRLILTHPEHGREILERAGLPMIESDLVVVELRDETQPLLSVCTSLLQAEVNLVQSYPLMGRPGGRCAVALMVDNIDLAQATLSKGGFHMLNEDELTDLA